MMCLVLKPGAAGWKAHTNPRSYGCTRPGEILLKLFNRWRLLLSSINSDRLQIINRLKSNSDG